MDLAEGFLGLVALIVSHACLGKIGETLEALAAESVTSLARFFEGKEGSFTGWAVSLT